MISKLIIWGFQKSGYRKVGNYLLKDGKYTHQDRIVVDFLGGCVFAMVLMGFVVFMYLALWIL